MTEKSLFTYRRTRREFLRDVATLGGVMVGMSYLAACQPAARPPTGAEGGVTVIEPETTTAPGQLPRNETLYMAGHQWGPPTTFNPIAAGQITWPAGGQHQQIF